MPTPAHFSRPEAAASPAPRRRRRPRLVPDDTGVRLRQHAAQDRVLLELVERLAG